MTFVTHLKRLDGGGYASKREPTSKTFPVYSLPAQPSDAMADLVRAYLEKRSVYGINVEEMLTLALSAQKGGLA